MTPARETRFSGASRPGEKHGFVLTREEGEQVDLASHRTPDDGQERVGFDGTFGEASAQRERREGRRGQVECELVAGDVAPRLEGDACGKSLGLDLEGDHAIDTVEAAAKGQCEDVGDPPLDQVRPARKRLFAVWLPGERKPFAPDLRDACGDVDHDAVASAVDDAPNGGRRSDIARHGGVALDRHERPVGPAVRPEVKERTDDTQLTGASARELVLDPLEEEIEKRVGDIFEVVRVQDRVAEGAEVGLLHARTSSPGAGCRKWLGCSPWARGSTVSCRRVRGGRNASGPNARLREPVAGHLCAEPKVTFQSRCSWRRASERAEGDVAADVSARAARIHRIGLRARVQPGRRVR